MSNADKAIAVIKSFTTGDQTAILEYVSDETYIQHNLRVPDGREVVVNSYDLFRGQNRKIAEHWDVVTTITSKDSLVNQNGKF